MARINKIKGFADLFPPESNLYVFMEESARKVFPLYGYEEIRIPVLEKTELFARSIGGETDIVQKEMYTFADRKGRSLTLRPEATAGVVRAFIESGMASREGVYKFFTFGPMFRYERPQKGRMRQFHQIDVEMFGPEHPQADGELILMLFNYLQELGLNSLTFYVNSLGCKECRPQFQEKLVAFLTQVPEENLCADCQRRRTTNPLRVLDCKVEKCREVVREAPKITDCLCEECKKHFEQVITILNQSQIPWEHNPFLVRGLDYYQRTTFEVVSFDANIGAQSAIAGGGRYDGLVRNLGGPDVPGLGFACGMERIALLLEGQKQKSLDFFVAIIAEQALNAGIELAQRLRQKGYRGEVGFEVKSVKANLRQANKKKAKTCLILGEEELAQKVVQVKNLQTGLQQSVAWEDIEQALGILF